MRAGDDGKEKPRTEGHQFNPPRCPTRSRIGEREIRCVACGDEMILTNVAQDDRGAAHGYEHHTFSCSKCREIERRVAFMKHGRECNVYAAPPAVPVLTVHDEHVVPSEHLLGRLLAKIREDRWVSEISVAK